MVFGDGSMQRKGLVSAMTPATSLIATPLGLRGRAQAPRIRVQRARLGHLLDSISTRFFLFKFFVALSQNLLLDVLSLEKLLGLNT